MNPFIARSATPDQGPKSEVTAGKLLTTLNISGHADLSPAQALVKSHILTVGRKILVERGYGYRDTPVVERAEMYKGNAGDDVGKQMITIQGSHDLVLVPDHTAGLARHVARHMSDISFPYRTSFAGRAFRGERPQAGRRREFTQLDLDIVDSSPSKDIPLPEFEIMSTCYEILRAIGLKDAQITIGDRELTSLVLKLYKLDDNANYYRAIDRLDKMPHDKVIEGMVREGLVGDDELRNLGRMLQDLVEKPEEIHDRLKHNSFSEFKRVETLVAMLKAEGIPADALKVDLRLVRGLAYYNGMVFEAHAEPDSNNGSIAGGGRFDSLFLNYTKRELFGFGAAIGVDRIVDLYASSIISKPQVESKDFYFVVSDPKGAVKLSTISKQLRDMGQSVVIAQRVGDIKFNFSEAKNQNCAFYCLVDVPNNRITLKNLENQKTLQLPLDTNATEILDLLGRKPAI